jgi:hypothetical protein
MYEPSLFYNSLCPEYLFRSVGLVICNYDSNSNHYQTNRLQVDLDRFGSGDKM